MTTRRGTLEFRPFRMTCLNGIERSSAARLNAATRLSRDSRDGRVCDASTSRVAVSNIFSTRFAGTRMCHLIDSEYVLIAVAEPQRYRRRLALTEQTYHLADLPAIL